MIVIRIDNDPERLLISMFSKKIENLNQERNTNSYLVSIRSQ